MTLDQVVGQGLRRDVSAETCDKEQKAGGGAFKAVGLYLLRLRKAARKPV